MYFTYILSFRDRANSSSTSASLLSGDLASSDCVVKIDRSPDNEKKERGWVWSLVCCSVGKPTQPFLLLPQQLQVSLPLIVWCSHFFMIYLKIL